MPPSCPWFTSWQVGVHLTWFLDLCIKRFLYVSPFFSCRHFTNSNIHFHLVTQLCRPGGVALLRWLSFQSVLPSQKTASDALLEPALSLWSPLWLTSSESLWWISEATTKSIYHVLKVNSLPFLNEKGSWVIDACDSDQVHILFSSSAKSRDASNNKLESEVVPKVARMTVSGKKQTMGFDVPRYPTSIWMQRPFHLDSLGINKWIFCLATPLHAVSSAQGRTAPSLLQLAEVAAPKMPL